MNGTDGQPGRSNGASHSQKRLSHDELKARVRELSRGTSCLIQEPLDTGLWPSAGLSDQQMSLLMKNLAKQPGPG